MTESPNLELNKATAAAALTEAARHLHLTVLTTFAETGRAPTRANLIRAADDNGIVADDALNELAARDVVVFNDEGEIRAAYPFSPIPTAIRVSWDGGPTVYSMCAVDALGISAMLDRPVTIMATEPDTEATVTVRVDGDKAHWIPESAVVFAGATDDECCLSVDSTCGHINFFTTAEAAHTWAADHPEVSGVVLNQTNALACGVAEFASLMHTA
ncbi:alkylmercury lyase family protein [Haloechinothrix salitolerans]|uniref:Alkylmercury lyase family protein n=1 Tax=Haloechinothrix salitolerans TaxID=926830 RepID=A0ABW2C5A0_9PSEU